MYSRRRKISTVLLILCLVLIVGFSGCNKAEDGILSGSEAVSEAEPVPITETKLTISINYGILQQPMEIVRDIIVSADEEYSEILQPDRCSQSGLDYVYEYDMENFSDYDVFYVKPPIVYAAAGKIETSSVKPAVGAAAELTRVRSDGQETEDWFLIDSVETEELSPGTYSVTVHAVAEGSDLPPAPVLHAGDDKYEGEVQIYFDEDGGFESAEFRFEIPGNGEDEIYELLSSASMVFKKALSRVDPWTLNYFSNKRLIFEGR